MGLVRQAMWVKAKAMEFFGNHEYFDCITHFRQATILLN